MGWVNRGVSVIRQAPLGCFEIPSSLLNFKFLLVVIWRTMGNLIVVLWLGIVRYLILVCVLAFTSGSCLLLGCG